MDEQFIISPQNLEIARLEQELTAACAEIERAERIRLQLWDKLSAARTRIAELEGELAELRAVGRALAKSSAPAHAPGYMLTPIDLIQRVDPGTYSI